MNMKWRNWPYWVKGGLILSAIYLFISINGLIFCYLIKFGIISNLNLGFAGVLVAFILQLGYLIIPIVVGHTVLNFIAGAIIGWIIGKIRSKKADLNLDQS